MSSWGRGGDGQERGSKRKKKRKQRGNGSIGNFFGIQPPQDHGNDVSSLGKTGIAEESRPKSAAELSRELVAEDKPQSPLPIGGIRIKFPNKPYPSQFAMMEKIVKGLDRSQNCLLESPTGSGKSLALLCSVLAWQKAQKEKIKKETEEQRGITDCCCKCHILEADTSEYWPGKPQPPKPATQPLKPAAQGDESTSALLSATCDDSVIVVDSDEDDDFKPPAMKIKTPMGKSALGGRHHVTIQYEDTPTDPGATPTLRVGPPIDGPCTNCQCSEEDLAPPRSVPKIFFGTRTHKQIAQITRELAKTAYRDVRMCILASREHTCIDREVSRMPNKTEECKNKRDGKSVTKSQQKVEETDNNFDSDGPGCMFFDNVRKVTHRNLEANGLEYAWDLEDFMKFNRKHKSCPYYGARGLREGADIIFCPYNYLIDPVIREQMQIVLKGHVLVLDEAHNMEDSAREAASYSVTEPELEDAITDMNRVINGAAVNRRTGGKFNEAELYRLKNVISAMGDWVMKWKDTLISDRDFENASKVWNGMEMVAQLKNCRIGPDVLESLRRDMATVMEDDPDHPQLVKLLVQTVIILEKTFYVLSFIYRDDYKFMNDYRIALTRTMSYQSNNTDGQWLNKSRRQSFQKKWLFTLHFWCMNPAVAFSDLANVRSIILTSGTLSPMNSFQSELGQPFKIQLEASHVIDPKQVWVGAVTRGPRGNSLLGTFQSSETYTYQDEVGALALDICKTVRHGVLCFFSSYKTLDKLLTRWQTTGLHDQIAQHKVVMREPRGSDRDKVDFDQLLLRFDKIIKETENVELYSGEQTGVFFLAVCRGKVSEGMDFANNNARAVITVGIPFPSKFDTQVLMKIKYNNEHTESRGLLTGNNWYEIQAYRAINQALGRCIRHKYDWGALILVDERFKPQSKYIKGLSKWVRGKVKYYKDATEAVCSLQQFTENMTACPPAPGQDTTLSVSQMDLNTTVVTDDVLGSPAPPVLPPQPARHASPPMDLNSSTQGGVTGQYQQPPGTPTSHRGATSFVLTSQAGGFMVSQGTQCQDGVANKPNTSQLQPPKSKVENNPGPRSASMIVDTQGGTKFAATQSTVKQEDVVARPPATQALNLNQTLDFAPPLAASTQHQGGLAFKPGFTSTQFGTQSSVPATGFVSVSSLIQSNNVTTPKDSANDTLSLTPIRALKDDAIAPKCESNKVTWRKLSFEGNGKSIKQKLSKLTHKGKDDPDYEPEFEVPISSQRVLKGTVSKKLSQCVEPTNCYGDEELDIDERSSSPLLFDSEDCDDDKLSEDFDAVMEHLADATLPREIQTVDEIRGMERGQQNCNYKRPLFKSKTNTIGQEDTKVGAHGDYDISRSVDIGTAESVVECHENIPPVPLVVVEGKAKQKPVIPGRLSRQHSREIANKTVNTPNPEAQPTVSDKSKANLIDEQNNTQNTNTQATIVDKTKCAVRVASKRTAKGVFFDSDGNEGVDEIVTKRATLRKRRCLAPPRVRIPPCDFLDEVNPTEKTESSLAVCCNHCGIQLTPDLEGVRKEALPRYVSACLPTCDQRLPDPQTTTCDQAVTRLKMIKPVDATSQTGLKMNSIWSEEGGCCLLFYRCPSLQCSPRPVAVCVIATSSNSRATEGQVWFLPHMTKTSEPT